MKILLHFTQCDTLRASSDRPNLAYRVQWLDAVRGASCREKELVEEAVRVCMEDIREWRAMPDARGICYVLTKALRNLMAEKLQCAFYHGDLTEEERLRLTAAWSQGGSGPYMVATAAFNAGVHHPSVRRILDVDAPDGLVNYGQETGRAGRDGLPAVCLVLLPTSWKVAWDQGFQSDFLRARSCLRLQLTAYLDGAPGTSCTVPAAGISSACSVCVPPLPSRRPEASAAMRSTPPVDFSATANRRPLSGVGPARSSSARRPSALSAAGRAAPEPRLSSGPPPRPMVLNALGHEVANPFLSPSAPSPSADASQASDTEDDDESTSERDEDRRTPP